MFEIQQTKDKKLTDGISLLIYGKAGVGKTSLVNTLDPSSTLIINAEEGIQVVKNNISYINCKNLKEIKELSKFLLTTKYQTIFIDSLSYITELFVMQYPESKNNFSVWQNLNKEMNLLVFDLMQLVTQRKNVVCICKQTNDGEPLLAGNKIQDSLPHMFTSVLNMTTSGAGREIKRNLVVYKSRENSFLSGDFLEPNLTNLFKQIYERRSTSSS